MECMPDMLDTHMLLSMDTHMLLDYGHWASKTLSKIYSWNNDESNQICKRMATY